MNPNVSLADQAAERWARRTQEREENMERVRNGRSVEADSPERVQARLERLQMNVMREQIRAAEVAVATSNAPPQPTTGIDSSIISQLGRERIMGRSDFLNINFLELALALSRYVGRINIKLSRTQTVGYGTGFMVSPRLLITNNHVLPTKQDALFSEIEFDYQYDRFGRLLPVVNYGLEPQTFFMTDYNLDFTLVAVSNMSVDNKTELKTYGWNRLIRAEGKALIGESLNIIQHPRGEAKQIALRSNKLLDLLDEGFAHYETDTEPGSSGSPVFNDQWEVVALHHSGVPRKVDGQFINVDGKPWHEGDDPDRLDWVANEGIRVSRIVEHIERQNLSTEQAILRKDLLEKEPPNPIIAAMEAIPNRASNITVPAAPKPTHQESNGLQFSGGSVSFTIPLNITVQFGAPQNQVNSSAPETPPNIPNSQLIKPTSGDNVSDDSFSTLITNDRGNSTELRSALAKLEAAPSKPYYDEAADTTARNQYYQSIQPDNINAGEFFDALRDLLARTHTNKFNYKPATHLYPWIDLQESGSQLRIKSIYSGREFSPQEFIEADFRVDAERARLSEVLTRESSFSAMEAQRQMDMLEASMPYNCEHVVPQSWFNKKEPMKGDLHHLFACEVGCNSFRSNIPYFDFPDDNETIREACGRKEETRFEPIAGKGAVARATLYFLLRYPKEINNIEKEYTPERIQMILRWSEANPVTRYEKHRNAAIYEKQGNRNPLIDFPEWAARIDFIKGLGQ